MFPRSARPGVLAAVRGRLPTRLGRQWRAGGDLLFKRSARISAPAHRLSSSRIFPPAENGVAVIGAGVAGLTAARELALSGHGVTVFEKHRTPGGMLNQGIPAFRLPREIVDREIRQVAATGVIICCGVEIGTDRHAGPAL